MSIIEDLRILTQEEIYLAAVKQYGLTSKWAKLEFVKLSPTMKVLVKMRMKKAFKEAKTSKIASNLIKLEEK